VSCADAHFTQRGKENKKQSNTGTAAPGLDYFCETRADTNLCSFASLRVSCVDAHFMQRGKENKKQSNTGTAAPGLDYFCETRANANLAPLLLCV